MSAYELSHGFSKPLANQLMMIPDDIANAAQQAIEAKRNLTRILRSRFPDDKAKSTGDSAEIFVKTAKEKREKWKSPLVVLDVNYDNCKVTPLRPNGRFVKAAYEDARIALADDSFAQIVSEANDKHYSDIDLLICDNNTDDIDENDKLNSYDESTEIDVMHTSFEPCYSTDDPPVTNTICGTAEKIALAVSNASSTERGQKQSTMLENDVNINAEPDVFDKFEIFWLDLTTLSTHQLFLSRKTTT